MEMHTNRQAESVILSVLGHYEMTFGTKLKAWRKTRGWTQEELARATGLSFPYISNLERDFSTTSKSGKVKPSERTVEKLSRALGVPIEEIRHAAGYALERPEETYELPEGVVIMFQDEEKLTTEDRKKILEIVTTVVKGIASERKDL